jgi:L-ascorbate metabolism protein UlaG (beta-lactamase superfamily)
MIIILVIIVVIIAVGYIIMQQAPFGRAAKGERLKKIQSSPNYKDGQFQNQSFTPALTEGVSYFSAIKEFIFANKDKTRPPTPLPSKKTDLLNIPRDKNILVWFGHSSYFMQVDGKKILVDPVFSGHASPFSFTTKSFPGSDIYTVDDLPEIDYLFLTHDHWDHLDYKTVGKLKEKVNIIITSLGVGAHLERWGFRKDMIREEDWNEMINPDPEFNIITMPGRHFSGRGFKRNQSLWSSFILITPTKKIFIGGDSGYDQHFTEIGNQHGPFDLVILENGQYDLKWKYIHMLPEEVVQAAIDLKAKALLPVHWSKFSLSLHDWDEPIKRLTIEAVKRDLKVIHPMIGESVDLEDMKVGEEWWQLAGKA